MKRMTPKQIFALSVLLNARAEGKELPSRAVALLADRPEVDAAFQLQDGRKVVGDVAVEI